MADTSKDRPLTVAERIRLLTELEGLREELAEQRIILTALAKHSGVELPKKAS